MPEGDVVWRSCRRLHEALAGRALIRCEFRVPALATTDLTGVMVDEVVSRGKHQLFRFADGFTLHSHFRMDGAWRIYPTGRTWSGGPDWQVRAVLGTDDHVAVGYRLPVLELVPTAEENTVVGHLGPDLLGPDWDEAEAVRRLLEAPDRPVFEALRDQTRLAGIGTIYAAEVGFVMGVAPTRPIAEVADLPRMVRRVRQMLDQDWSRSNRMWVYRQRLCRRCGTQVRVDQLGPAGRERSAYWCPSCQK